MAEHRFDIKVPRLGGAGRHTEPGTVAALRAGEESRAGWSGRPPGAKLFLAPDLVVPRSPLAVRKAVERLAYYFRREFGYDFVQYNATERTDARDRAWLWTHHLYEGGPVGVGACCFRWRDWENAPHGYGLAWAWFHPYVRRQGLLSASWPYFRTLYGDFVCEPPVSPAMRSFLAARKECWRCGRACVCAPEPASTG